MLGCIIEASAIAFFINGCGLIPSGVTGVATILKRVVDFPVGGSVFVISSAIMVSGLVFLGVENFEKTMFCITVYSGCVEIAMHVLPVYTGNMWFAAIIGGIFVGIGNGLILFGRGSLGTTDLIGMILNKYLGINIGTVIFTLDMIPIIVGAAAFKAGALFPSILYLASLTIVIWILNPKMAD